MPLDVLEADLPGAARNRVDCSASRNVDAHLLKLDLILKTLQRDDPLRRFYLQRRWHSWAMEHECTSLLPNALSRR